MEIDIRIVAFIAIEGRRTDLQHAGQLGGPILQVMAMGFARRERGAVPSAQDLLAVSADQHNLALDDIDELLGMGVPMVLARPRARLQLQEVDAELREAGRLRQAASQLVPAWHIEWRRVA